MATRVDIEYTEYKHSRFATFCSKAGSYIAMFSMFLGASVMFSGDFGDGLLVMVIGVALGVGLSILGGRIGFNSWWKYIERKGLISEIVNSSEVAIAVYKANPDDQTLKKIQQLNPTAADYIRASNVK